MDNSTLRRYWEKVQRPSSNPSLTNNMSSNRFSIRTPLPNWDSNDEEYENRNGLQDHWTHYQWQRQQRYSNQRQFGRQYQQYHHDDDVDSNADDGRSGGQMENNHHHQRPRQSKWGIRDPNNNSNRHRHRQQQPVPALVSDHRHPYRHRLQPSAVGGWMTPLMTTTRTSTRRTTTKPLIEGRKRNYRTKAKAFIIEFLQGASLHGFIYLSKVGLHFVERALWLVFICIAIFGVVSLSHRTWERFQTSPMVISMDRNKLVWNTSFPSLTVCPHKRIDENKVEEFLMIHKQNFPTGDDKEDFRVFIEKLASLSYDNIESLPMNKTFSIPSAKYLDILYELKWNFEPELSSGTAVKMNVYQTITEMGICHSVNSLIGQYNSYDYWRSNDWNLLDHGDRVTVHPLDGEIYAQIINLSTGYDVYFHSAGDIPNISKQRYTFPETDYTTVELVALETFTTPRAKEFKINQRKCRFPHESEEMMTAPIYSYGLCLTECRMKLALRVCRCVPHFYRNRVKGGRILPVCDFNGLSCLAQIKREIISLKSDTLNIDCKCLANCDDSNFFVQSYRSRVWFLGANLQWGIIDYPKMQLRRDVLFSFADVLVYIGGLAGFFLGCSILTLTEIVYFFTARFMRRLFCN